MARARIVGALLVVFGVLVLAWTYPLWTMPTTHLNEIFDARFVAWVLGWDAHAVVDAEARLFDANVFHPHGLSLAFSENLLGTALLVAPFNWAGEPVLAYNMALLLGFLLTGAATALWVRSLTGSILAGVFAGAAFTFGASRADHLPHLQLLHAQYVPLLLIACHRWLATRRASWLVAAGALGAIQFAAGIQLTLVMLPVLAVYAIGLLAHARAHGTPLRPWPTARAVVAAGIVSVVLAAPIGIPYLEVAEGEGFERTIRDTRAYSAQPKSLVAPAVTHRAPHATWMAGYRLPEANHFPGWAVLMVLGVGGALALREPRPRLGSSPIHRAASVAFAAALVVGMSGLFLAQWWSRPQILEPVLAAIGWLDPAVWITLLGLVALATWRPRDDLDLGARMLPCLLMGALVSFLLALGPTVRGWNFELGTGPFAWLWDLAVPYRSIRAVGRFGIATSFCLTAAAGIVAARLARRSGRPRAATAVLIALVALVMVENRVGPLPVRRALPPDMTLFRQLRDLPGDGGVLHLPLMPGNFHPYTSLYQLGSTEHWKPLVFGYSGFIPPDIQLLIDREPLAPPFMDYLESELSVDWVVLHRDLVEEERWETLHRRAIARPDLERVFEHPTGEIYRFDARVRRGTNIGWRYRADQLRRVARLRAAIRTADDVTAPVQWILNGREIASLPVGPTWQEVEIPLPASLEPLPDGSARLLVRAGDLGNPDGEPREMVVDAQESARSLAIGGGWMAVERGEPLLAVHVDRALALPVDTRALPLSAAGVDELAAWIEDLPEGALVTVAIRPPRDQVVAGAPLMRALRGLGADLPDDAVFRGLALIGTRGGAHGTARQQTTGSRATVQTAGTEGPARAFVVRDLTRVREER